VSKIGEFIEIENSKEYSFQSWKWSQKRASCLHLLNNVLVHKKAFIFDEVQYFPLFSFTGSMFGVIAKNSNPRS
jgi:hypothetical protein